MSIKDEAPSKLKELERTCYICNKQLAVFVGTPIIKKLGFKFDDKKNKKEYIYSRPAHVHCYFEELDKAIRKEEREETLAKVREKIEELLNPILIIITEHEQEGTTTSETCLRFKTQRNLLLRLLKEVESLDGSQEGCKTRPPVSSYVKAGNERFEPSTIQADKLNPADSNDQLRSVKEKGGISSEVCCDDKMSFL